MGGVDKGLQLFDGRPLAAHAIDRLRPQVSTIVVSANRGLDAYTAFGWPVVTDRIASDAGPLAGLHAGLVACGTAYLAVVPCDAPRFPHDLVERLTTAFTDGDIDIAVARTGARAHPVFCLMRTSVAADLAAFVDSGGRRVATWLEGRRTREVSFDDEGAFDNLNTFDELRAAERS